MRKIRIIFMGTPEFAVEPLRQLIENKFEIAAVVTVADKPAGRGLKTSESAVKRFAVSQGLPVLQPISLKDEKFINDLDSYEANLFVVVAFRKLPDEVWKLPEFGTINLHASLLPNYRGAAPINHAIINGEMITGVTTFFLNSEIDTGKIIMSREVIIDQDETAGELHDKLSIVGAQLVVDTVMAIAEETCEAVEQPKGSPDIRLAPRIYREHRKIDWSKTCVVIHNFIRGLSPYPGAYTKLTLGDKITEAKILRTALLHYQEKPLRPGEVIIKDRNRLLVACSDSFIEILKLQVTDKKALMTSDFLRGIKSDYLFFG